MKKFKYIIYIFTLISVFLLTACSPKPYQVTQYGDPNGLQESFYSIKTPDDNLIIIDGGWAENEEDVRQVIADNGNKVDAWILTHPHPDHIGAFNRILSDPQGIEIKQIYASDMDYDYYNKHKKEWDGFEVYEEFLDLTEGADNLQYLYEGDELEIEGLNVLVLHSANNESPDPPNDDSLILKMSGDEESILFTGDVGKSRNEYILENHKDDLKADYLQMSHHGNGGLSDEIYALVSPKIAFADCPDWLRNNIDPNTGEPSHYKTPEKIAFLESLGCDVLSYTTAPNTIEFY